MKKQKVQLIVVAILLVLCIAGYFIIKNVNKNTEQEATTTTITVTNVESDNVKEIEYIYNGEAIAFIKDGDTWYYKNDKNITILQSEITTMLGYVCNVMTSTKIDNPEVLSVYGLDNPENTISMTLSDGSVVQIIVGDYLSITGEYYAMTSGDDAVYTIPSYCVSAFGKSIDELTETTETENSSEE